MKHAIPLLLVTSLLAAPAIAFEVEQPGAPMGTHEGVTIFKVDGTTYTITPIPNVADQFESFQTPPAKYEEGVKTLTLGAPITLDEATKVIEEYYRENAFDFASIRVRKLQVAAPQYVAWCSESLFLMCSLRQFRSGNWVEFEVNGANRSGGMTGFQRQVLMIRKL